MKSIIISIVGAVVLIGGAFMFATSSSGSGTAQNGNVSEENGTQVIAIAVQGDYAPELTEARAGVPSVLRLETNGTYSCALALKIPALGFEKSLDPTGVTEVPVPPQKAGTSLQGICSMGMYGFTINFI